MIIIKNIIFDLGGVILKEKPISILNKVNIDKETYNNLKIFFANWNNLDLGIETLEDKYNKCNFPNKYNNLYKNNLIYYYKYRDINMDIINLINKLKIKNYNVYILSDNNKESSNYYQNSSYLKNIDGWIVSCDYNTVKKDGKLFDILISKFNLNADECYFIDDNPANIKEAENHGIKSYMFNENDDISNLYNNMNNNGISI